MVKTPMVGIGGGDAVGNQLKSSNWFLCHPENDKEEEQVDQEFPSLASHLFSTKSMLRHHHLSLHYLWCTTGVNFR